jgi:monoamine oxidase
MVRYLAEQCEALGAKLSLQKEVRRIDFTGEEVQISCDDGSIYKGKKVVVTVPLSLLQAIHFNPAIPEKLEAATHIGFGTAMKILLRFKSRWWRSARGQNFENLSFIASNETIPTFWTQRPHTTLTGWVGGPKAQKLSEYRDEEILGLALQSLSAMFKVSLEELGNELIHSKIIKWSKDPFARGAYSYSTPQTALALRELLEPVDNKLFLAGEAICDDMSVGATVEAALQSGLRAAKLAL